jgi:BirA family biotin operon repressor/biotin-[acetyl-CoA-carboxylase] ligase
VSRRILLTSFLNQFEADYDLYVQKGFETLLPQVERASCTLGRTIAVQCGEAEWTGKALGFTQEGALRLLSGEGREEILWVGDVTRVEGLS